MPAKEQSKSKSKSSKSLQPTNLTLTLSDEEFLSVLEERFKENIHRHKQLNWSDAKNKLTENTLGILARMEASGGEPDVVMLNGALTFVDCSAESPKGRTNLCYDKAARTERKAHAPLSSAQEIADEIGISILDEDEYRALQKIEAFDSKTSSWILTPQNIRSLGGALFCDRRFDTVFTYHNGADSYYGVRGFRGKLVL